MEECKEWVTSEIERSNADPVEKKNFEAFMRMLNEPEIQNHRGRYLLIKNGVVHGETFESPQDTFSSEFDYDWVLFLIPEDNDFEQASIFEKYKMNVTTNRSNFNDSSRL